MKKLLALIPSVLLVISANPAQAGRIEPKPVSCYFFRGEKLEIQQTCIYESTSWAGGAAARLQWRDGVKTAIAWGLQGRGAKPCDEVSLDKVCGSTYHRHPKTLQRISKESAMRLSANKQQALYCVQAGRNSVCY